MSSQQHARKPFDHDVQTLTDEILEYAEAKPKKLTSEVKNRLAHIFSLFKAKNLKVSNPCDAGDLIASLFELVPVSDPAFIDLCEAVAGFCINRDAVAFTDEALCTSMDYILKNLESKPSDPSPGLRALSTLLYGNSGRLQKYHEAIIRLSTSLATSSDTTYRRSCTVLGNIAAFTQRSLPLETYSKSASFLVKSLAHKNIEIVKSSLRSLQLLVLDAPKESYDLQTMANIAADLALNQGPHALRFEALMLLKAMATSTKNYFYPLWPKILCGETSVFDLLTLNAKISKTTSDLLIAMFQGTWNYMYIANNIDVMPPVHTLAHQIGDIIDKVFGSFMKNMDKSKFDSESYSRLAKAFSTFIKNCSFDSGRLKTGYIEALVAWARKNIKETPDETLLILRSLLWTSVSFPSFNDSFDFLFQSFVESTTSESQEACRQSINALRRIAYAYPSEMVLRWQFLCPKLVQIGPVSAFPILVRLAENRIADLNVWKDILNLFVPAAFEINHLRSIQAALKCIGLSGCIFQQLPSNMQKFCYSTIIGNDSLDAVVATGQLAKSRTANNYNFLIDAFRKVITFSDPDIQSISRVLKAIKDTPEIYQPEWTRQTIDLLKKCNSPYASPCATALIPFANEEETEEIYSLIVDLLSNSEKKTKWKAAKAMGELIKKGKITDDAVSTLIDQVLSGKTPQVRINSAYSLANLTSRSSFGQRFDELFLGCVDILVSNVYFTSLPIAQQKKFDPLLRDAVKSLFFLLVRKTTSRDFSKYEELLDPNARTIFDIFANSENPPWVEITRLYEAKFSCIPSSLLIDFQNMAFPEPTD